MKRSLMIAIVALAVASVVAAQDLPKPRLIYSQLPQYPSLARGARVEGSVRLSFLLDEKGNVVSVEATSGHPMLKAAAADIVKSWRFELPRELYRTEWRYDTEFVYRLGVQSKSGEPRLTVSLKDFRRVEVSSELYVQPIP